MKKPTWMLWVAGVSIWAFFDWLTGVFVHQTIHRNDFALALESGLVGGTLTWWFALRRFQRKHLEVTNAASSNSLGSASSNV